VDDAQLGKSDGSPSLDRRRFDAEFTAFYRAEHDSQVRRAALLVGSHDALVEILRRWGTIEHPGSYLNRAVLNGCRDRARKERVVANVGHRLAIEEEATHDDAIFDVIARLPFNHRAAVIMRFYQRMTEQEIADALGCKPGSVGPWIHRALATMRKELS
jgi:RNA polymerase sigma factor (sigma-70 family)